MGLLRSRQYLESGEGFAVIVAANELDAGEHEPCIDADEGMACHDGPKYENVNKINKTIRFDLRAHICEYS